VPLPLTTALAFMTKPFSTLLALLACFPCFAASLLEGEWQSDHAKTMAFIEAHAVLDQKALDFHRSSFGRLKLSFSAGEVRSHLPDHEVTILGKVYPMVGFDETHAYEVLHEDQMVVVVRSLAPLTGKSMVGVFNFESPDSMWLYLGGGDGDLPVMHLREYFSRLRDEG
jgi:hypothetical protein